MEQALARCREGLGLHYSWIIFFFLRAVMNSRAHGARGADLMETSKARIPRSQGCAQVSGRALQRFTKTTVLKCNPSLESPGRNRGKHPIKLPINGLSLWSGVNWNSSFLSNRMTIQTSLPPTTLPTACLRLCSFAFCCQKQQTASGAINTLIIIYFLPKLTSQRERCLLIIMPERQNIAFLK